MEEHIYRDLHGMRCKITPGVIDGNARHLFMHGQCHALAAAVAAQHDLHVAIIRCYSGDDETHLIDSPHVLIQLDEDEFADVSGVHSESELEQMYSDREIRVEVEVMHPDDMLEELALDQVHYQSPQLELAATFVAPSMDAWEKLRRPQLSPTQELASHREASATDGHDIG